MNPSSSSSETVKTCVICYDAINSQTSSQSEQEKILDCSHIFHNACIGDWLKQKHNCPVCRAVVRVDTPEAPQPEMTTEEVLAVPDTQQVHTAAPPSVNNRTPVIRGVHVLNLNGNNPVNATARRVNTLASRLFGTRT